MPGSRSLRKLQLGVEATKGTAVAATAIWRGVGTIEDAREVKFVDEDSGYVAPLDRTYIPKLLAKLQMGATPATYQQLPYILAAGVQNVVTGSADGPGTDKIYTYNFPTTALQTIKSYTIEGGDDAQAERMEYSFVEAFKLKGNNAGDVEMSADWIGRQVTQNAFTPALTLAAVDDMITGKSKLFIDAIGGTQGTTPVTGSVLEWEFDCKTGWVPHFTADGNTSPYFIFEALDDKKLDIQFKVIFEHETSFATVEKGNWRTQTPRLLQLKVTGNAVTTPGTTYSNDTLLLNMAGKWLKFDKLGEKDGNDTIQGTFKVTHDLTAAKFCQIIVVNELASLP